VSFWFDPLILPFSNESTMILLHRFIVSSFHRHIK
ncbi:MAG: hypothetical protein ACI90V_012910, partial [Bacillariaceae sp.]|jgi:hypothetical protein